MCSVEGFTGKHDFTIEQFSKFNECRGPDGTTYYQDNYISLGHSLLAISPNQTPLRQPWKMENGNYLVWNGEIYGLEDGVFDTEWLSQTISSKSLAALKRGVNWMGAGVIYDVKNLKLVLFRDHFGIKPLYYTQLNGDLFWSSTPRPLYAVLNNKGKSIKKDKKHWDCFQANDRHGFGSHTPIERIQRLHPGQILTYDLRAAKFESSDTFWGSDESNWTLHSDLNWTPDELEKVMIENISQVCHAPGIPKTISLSGGLDSTLIASIAKGEDDIDVQTVEYENFKPSSETINHNMMLEYLLAQRTAEEYGLQYNGTDYPYDNNELTKEGQFALSVPQWDRNRWSTRYANVKAAAERGRKIYIVGDGADELMTGYNGDYDYFSRAKGRPGMDRTILDKFASNDLKWNLLREIIPHWLFGHDTINNRLFARLFQHVDSFCTTVDHICGNFGMESRVPFLSQDLAKYLLKIPGTDKLHVPYHYDEQTRDMYKGHYKILIRDYMSDHLPDHIKERHTKIGFSTPWNARDNKRNIGIAKEDWKIFKYQAETYFNFDNVDFNNEWKDNTQNDQIVEVNLSENSNG